MAPFPVVGFEEGWPVSYDDASLSPEECRRRDRELAEWRQKGCLHPGMAMCERWITNISGMSMFRQALGDHAHGDCPCLERELPRYNGGETAPADARAIRHELEVLRGNLATDASPVVVTNSHGLQVMFEGDAPRSIVEDATNWLLDGRSNSPTTLATGSFALLGRDPAPDYADGWAYGLGQDALQIFHNNEVVLRGMRLTQRPIRSTDVIPTRFPSQKEYPTLLPCPVSVRDDESGTLVTLPGPLFEGYITSIDLPHRYVAWPVHIDVKRQVRHEDIVLAVIDALEDLCDASIATDNPLCWTSRAQPAFGGTPS